MTSVNEDHNHPVMKVLYLPSDVIYDVCIILNRLFMTIYHGKGDWMKMREEKSLNS